MEEEEEYLLQYHGPSNVLDVETRMYLKKIVETAEQFQQEEEENDELLINNAFSELSSKKFQVCVDKHGSRLIERLFQFATPSLLVEFFEPLNEKYLQLLTHFNASHVMESFFNMIPKFLDNKTEAGERLVNVIFTISNQVKSHLSDLMVDKYSSHCIRTLLKLLTGNSNMQETDPKNPEIEKIEVPASFKKVFQEIYNQVLELDLKELVFDSFVSPFLQVLLKVSDSSESLIEKILNFNSKKERASQIENMITDSIASHTMEVILQVCSPDMYSLIYTDYFRHKLLERSKHPVANFVVQHLISNVNHQAQVTMIFDELKDHISALLANGKIGIIHKLVKACHKFKVKEDELCKILINLIPENTNLAQYFLEFKHNEKTKFSGMGGQILESLFEYNIKPISVVLNAMTSLSPEYVEQMAFDSIGSRVIESFIKSSVTPQKKKTFYINLFKGKFIRLSQDKYGAHLVETCYQTGDVKLKEKIVSELLPAEKELANSFYGRFVLRKCKIDQYKRKKESWIQHQEQVEKKRKMFENFLEDDTDEFLVPKNKKKKISPEGQTSSSSSKK